MTRNKRADRSATTPKAWWQRVYAGEPLPKDWLKQKSKCGGTVEDHRNIALDVRELDGPGGGDRLAVDDARSNEGGSGRSGVRTILAIPMLKENEMIGCVSSEGWRVQQEVDLPG